jgi:hypothetical protein
MPLNWSMGKKASVLARCDKLVIACATAAQQASYTVHALHTHTTRTACTKHHAPCTMHHTPRNTTLHHAPHTTYHLHILVVTNFNNPFFQFLTNPIDAHHKTIVP